MAMNTEKVTEAGIILFFLSSSAFLAKITIFPLTFTYINLEICTLALSLGN